MVPYFTVYGAFGCNGQLQHAVAVATVASWTATKRQRRVGPAERYALPGLSA